DGGGALVGLGRAHDVVGGRGLQPARVPQRNGLAPRQFADRAWSCPLRPLARGAADRAANADRGQALRLPAAGGLRRPAPLRDLVPDRLPDRRPPPGLGRRDAGAPAPGAARAPAGPAPAPAGDPRPARASLMGRKAATLRDSRL